MTLLRLRSNTRVDGVTVRTWGDDAQICPTGCKVFISHPPVIQVSVKHRESPGRKGTRVAGRGWLVHGGQTEGDGGVEAW